jgi:hypothetical protein
MVFVYVELNCLTTPSRLALTGVRRFIDIIFGVIARLFGFKEYCSQAIFCNPDNWFN